MPRKAATPEYSAPGTIPEPHGLRRRTTPWRPWLPQPVNDTSGLCALLIRLRTAAASRSSTLVSTRSNDIRQRRHQGRTVRNPCIDEARDDPTSGTVTGRGQNRDMHPCCWRLRPFSCSDPVARIGTMTASPAVASEPVAVTDPDADLDDDMDTDQSGRRIRCRGGVDPPSPERLRGNT